MKKKIFLLVLLHFFLLCRASATDFYWVGGAGSWIDLNHWATTSGGSTHPVSIPSQNDDVFFDANSFSAGGQTVSYGANINCKSMDWTGVTNSPTFASTTSNIHINIYGSLTLVSGMTLSDPFGSTQWWLQGAGLGKTVTTAGKSFYAMYFSGTGGEWTLQDDVTTSFIVYLDRGTLNTNNKTVTTGIFSSYTDCGGCNIRTLNLGSSIINCSSQWIIYSTGLTLNAGTSVINAASFMSGGQTYNNVTVNGSSGVPALNTSSDIFTHLTISTTVNTTITGSGPMSTTTDFVINGPAKTIFINPTVQVNLNGSLTVNSSPSEIITIQSSINGVQANFNKSGGKVCISDVTLKDLNAAGGATFYASNSTDNGNNTGWNFTSQSCLVILPVQLLSFDIACSSGNILFSWKTAMEINSSHFEIQKQTNTGWITIGNVTASGESQSERAYRFQSGNQGGVFRLVTVDRDGKKSYSIIKTIQCKPGENITIASNPVYDELNVEIKSTKKEKMSLQVINVLGQVIRNEEVQVIPGINKFRFNLSAWAPGKYILSVQPRSIRIPFLKM